MTGSPHTATHQCTVADAALHRIDGALHSVDALLHTFTPANAPFRRVSAHEFYTYNQQPKSSSTYHVSAYAFNYGPGAVGSAHDTLASAVRRVACQPSERGGGPTCLSLLPLPAKHCAQNVGDRVYGALSVEQSAFWEVGVSVRDPLQPPGSTKRNPPALISTRRQRRGRIAGSNGACS